MKKVFLFQKRLYLCIVINNKQIKFKIMTAVYFDGTSYFIGSVLEKTKETLVVGVYCGKDIAQKNCDNFNNNKNIK